MRADRYRRRAFFISHPSSLSPHPLLPLPPLLLARRVVIRREIHLLSHVIDAPTRQPCQVARLLLLTVAQRAAVVARRIAVRTARPRMMEDVAGLKVLTIARLLKHEILGEVLAVVADVQPSQKNI